MCECTVILRIFVIYIYHFRGVGNLIFKVIWTINKFLR